MRAHVLPCSSVTACSQHCRGGPGRVGSPAVAQGGPCSRLPWLPCEVVMPRAGELLSTDSVRISLSVTWGGV